MTRVNKKQKQSETKLDGSPKYNGANLVVTSKHEDCNLIFTNHGKEDGIYPLKEIAKHKTKIRDLL
jgi:hypothetical protein